MFVILINKFVLQSASPNKEKGKRKDNNKVDPKEKNNTIEKESKRNKKKKVPPRNYLGKTSLEVIVLILTG